MSAKASLSTPEIEPAGKRRSGTEQYLYEVITGKPGAVHALLRVVLALLAPLYCLGLEIYLLPYNAGIRKRHRLRVPVICVGNLTTGGTGKTPMTQLVCRLLQEAGRNPVVLSRGYGGANEYGCAVVSDRDQVLLSAAEAGDEASMLARSLPGVPVVVGKDRRITGDLAVATFAPDVIVMDDGMQYWQLHRDLNIVLLNASKPFDNGYTFPRGLLREPKSHLRRAGLVVVTGIENATRSEIDTTIASVKRICRQMPVFEAGLEPIGVRDIADGVKYPLEWLRTRRPACMSAIGNPAAFESMVERLSAGVAQRVRFRDHEAVGNERITDLLIAAEDAGADTLITTEKDASRIVFPISNIPVVTLQVEMQIDELQDFKQAIKTVAAQ